MTIGHLIHRMGPFSFFTRSDFTHPAFSDPCIESFRVDSAGSIEASFDLSLVGDAEMADGSGDRSPGGPSLLCHSPSRIRGGSQLLPLLLPRGFETRVRDHIQGQPLAMSTRVARRIEEAVDGASDPSRISILAHALTVEIRDFENLAASVYIAEGLEDLLGTRAAYYSLRRLFSLFLPSLGSVMIHCSAVSLGCGTILLAAGDSGGKTTASMLAPTGSVLGDDRNLLVGNGGVFRAYRAPWNTMSSNQGGGPVAGVFLLEKAVSFSIRRTDHREVFAFLWQDNAAYFEDLPPPERDRAFEALLDLCRAVPCGTVSFAPDRLDYGALSDFVTRGA